MKNLLFLPLVLLPFCVIAEDRVILGSFEQESAESEDGERGIDAESSLTGFGARLYQFRDEGLYLGTGFAQLSGDLDICQRSLCLSADASRTRFFGDIGKSFGQWTPFIGTSFSSWEVEAPGQSESDETWGVNAGLWLDLDTFKLRGALSHLDDSDNRAISGGLLFQMENKFTLSAEIGLLLDDEVDEFRISLQFGKTF
ncbi:MAG: hypothetical protein F4Z01_08185 [Gammaproteobacteria bacterium]|nr:hypothetical protein [Gammaproteobacteria bacterium]MYF37170.1 hypothetical protein [Gammaproteobacteria bacterium]